MNQLELLNKLTPGFHRQYGWNSTRDQIIKSIGLAYKCSDEESDAAIRTIGMLSSGCYELMKQMVQAQMSKLSTPEERAEPDYELFFQNTYPGLSLESKEAIIRQARWLISKG
jgi:hypothetical protein